MGDGGFGFGSLGSAGGGIGGFGLFCDLVQFGFCAGLRGGMYIPDAWFEALEEMLLSLSSWTSIAETSFVVELVDMAMVFQRCRNRLCKACHAGRFLKDQEKCFMSQVTDMSENSEIVFATARSRCHPLPFWSYARSARILDFMELAAFEHVSPNQPRKTCAIRGKSMVVA